MPALGISQTVDDDDFGGGGGGGRGGLLAAELTGGCTGSTSKESFGHGGGGGAEPCCLGVRLCWLGAGGSVRYPLLLMLLSPSVSLDSWLVDHFFLPLPQAPFIQFKPDSHFLPIHDFGG